MKERPILFSGPMVRALLDGSKTQTRRVVKRQPRFENGVAAVPVLMWPNGVGGEFGELNKDVPDRLLAMCPYGKPGDRLWVKETWRTADTLDKLSPSAIANKCLDAGYSKPWAPLQWEADGRRNRDWGGFGPGNGVVVGPGKTRVSIHMPHWASRITLEVTGVRVERLHELSEADAIAEGIEQMPCSVPDTRLWRNYDPSNGWTPSVAIPQNSYRSLWDSINGADAWAANPWVWVVEFKRLP